MENGWLLISNSAIPHPPHCVPRGGIRQGFRKEKVTQNITSTLFTEYIIHRYHHLEII